MVITVLALEIVARVAHLGRARVSWTLPDARVGHRFVPNRRYSALQENDHPIEGRFNAQGWRDGPWSPVASPGEYRAAILGDSFVEAFQVEEDSTFLNIAERHLTRVLGGPVELMNFGRSGFTQTEQLLVLQDDAMPLDPDVVVLLFFPGNDISDVRRETAQDPARPFFREDPGGTLALDTSFARSREFALRRLVAPIKTRSALVSVLTERIRLLMSGGQVASMEETVRAGFLSLCTSTPSPDLLESFRWSRRLIAEMVALTKSAGAEFILVTLENVTIYPQERARAMAADATLETECFDDRMAQFADSLGVAHIGLQSRFEQVYERDGDLLHWNGEGHWNYTGHRAVAEALVGPLADAFDKGRPPARADSVP